VPMAAVPVLSSWSVSSQTALPETNEAVMRDSGRVPGLYRAMYEIDGAEADPSPHRHSSPAP
jgi:hypothetical protein